MSHYRDLDPSFLFAPDGTVRVWREESIPQNYDRHKTEKQMHRDATYADANICLTCTKKTCSGDLSCFLERKKKLDKQKQKNQIIY
jgi:hypothetical protein